MPELPEVETFAKKLNSWIVEPHLIEKAEVLRGSNYLPQDQAKQIEGKKILSVKRRGKFLIFLLDSGLIVCHNAMSGFWDSSRENWTFDYVEGKRSSSENDVRVKLFLRAPDGSPLTLNFHDSRLFGSLQFYDAASWQHVLKLIKLGPELLVTENLVENAPLISFSQAEQIFKGQKKSVKELLLDQSKVVGLGNIYVAEACHLAKVDPRRAGKTLSTEEIGMVMIAAETVMKQALARDLNYSALNVYRRVRCGTCGFQILNEEIKGRSTFICTACQS